MSNTSPKPSKRRTMSNLKIQAQIFADQRDKVIQEMQKRNPSLDYNSISETWTITKLAELQLQINELKFKLQSK